MMKNLSLNVPHQAKSANILAGVADADQLAMSGQADGAMSFQEELTSLVKGKKAKGVDSVAELISTDLVAGSQVKDKKKASNARESEVNIDALLAGGTILTPMVGNDLPAHLSQSELSKTDATAGLKGLSSVQLTPLLPSADAAAQSVVAKDGLQVNIKDNPPLTPAERVTLLAAQQDPKTSTPRAESSQLKSGVDAQKLEASLPLNATHQDAQRPANDSPVKGSLPNQATQNNELNTQALTVNLPGMSQKAAAPVAQPVADAASSQVLAPTAQVVQPGVDVASTQVPAATNQQVEQTALRDAAANETSFIAPVTLSPSPVNADPRTEKTMAAATVAAPVLERAQPSVSPQVATPDHSDGQPVMTAATQPRTHARVDEAHEVALNAKVSANQSLEQPSMPANERGFKVEAAPTQAMQAAQAAVAAQTNLMGGLNPVTESAAGSSNVISAYPGKANWNEAISQKVMWMIGTQDQSASLTLNPPDMGPLQVIVHVNNNMVDATFISDNLEVRQALENGMLALRDNMSESGIVLDQVNIGTSGNPGQSFRQEAQAQPNAAKSFSQLDAGQNGEVELSPTPRARVSNGLVDTFA